MLYQKIHYHLTKFIIEKELFVSKSNFKQKKSAHLITKGTDSIGWNIGQNF